MINNTFHRLKIWFFGNKLEFFIIILILAIAAFLRLYRISDYMIFLGDEGRDAIVVKNLITKADPIFIGPVTSVGNMYLGPFYYYMMSPFLALTLLNPIGPAIMVALIGVSTVFLIYLFSRLFFTKEVGFFAASLYAISPVVINYSRFSWNPNPAPFFSILEIIFLTLFLKNQKYLWFILSVVSYSFLIQMHYLAIIMIFPIFTVWFLFLAKTFLTAKKGMKGFLLGTSISLVIFLVSILPLIIFDLKPEHKFLNFNSFKAFLKTNSNGVSSSKLSFSFIPKNFFEVFENLFGRFIVAKEVIFYPLAILTGVLGFFWSCLQLLKSRKQNFGFFILTLWLFVGVLGLSLYKGELFDHYFGFLNPVPFLLISFTLCLFWKKNLFFKGLAILIFSFLLGINFYYSPLRYEPNYQLKRTKMIADEIIKFSDEKTFNFALISENNYDDAYRYFLDLKGHKAIVIDNQNLNTVTDQLFVVCEDKVCQPLGYSKWEVAGFGIKGGLAKIEKDWDLEGVRVFKLVHMKT